MNRKLGITLVEVIVVTAIVATLVAIVWMTVGPAAKRRGIESSVRNDLRQLSAGLAIYMSDHGDALPLGMSSLVAQVPTTPAKPTVVKEFLPGCGAGKVQYHLTRNEDILKGERRYVADYPFDYSANPVFKAPFYCRLGGTKQSSVFGNGHWQAIQRKSKLVLGSRIDGSTNWFDSWEQWEEEFAAKAHRQ